MRYPTMDTRAHNRQAVVQERPASLTEFTVDELHAIICKIQHEPFAEMWSFVLPSANSKRPSKKRRYVIRKIKDELDSDQA